MRVPGKMSKKWKQKGGQRERKGGPKEAKGGSKGAPGGPKGRFGCPKGGQRAPKMDPKSIQNRPPNGMCLAIIFRWVFLVEF